jgi:hypothetical protein
MYVYLSDIDPIGVATRLGRETMRYDCIVATSCERAVEGVPCAISVHIYRTCCIIVAHTVADRIREEGLVSEAKVN